VVNFFTDILIKGIKIKYRTKDNYTSVSKMTSPGKKSIIPPMFSIEEIERCNADLKYIQQFQANLKADLGTKQLRHDTLIENGWRTVKNFMGWGMESREQTYRFISRTCDNADKIMRERFPSKERLDQRRACAVYQNFINVDKGIQQVMKTYDKDAGTVANFEAIIENNEIRRKDLYELYSDIIDREGDLPSENNDDSRQAKNSELF